jgi:hypothetical protein
MNYSLLKFHRLLGLLLNEEAGFPTKSRGSLRGGVNVHD